MPKLPGIIKSQDLNKKIIEVIFSIAGKMEKKYPKNILRGKILISFFKEESTRTRLSTESAMKKLGGAVIGTEMAGEFSSMAKGESLEDSIRIISGYGDVIVLRHDKEGSAEIAQKFSDVPVINAGDGPGQHPTQALIDLYTIKKYFGKITDLKIALVGDLKFGRTVRSLCYLLAKHYPSKHLFLISPKQARMKDDIKDYLKKHDVEFTETDKMNHILPDIDVLYQTRVQKARYKKEKELYKQVLKASKKLYITESTLMKMKKGAIIMHPLPRNNEISREVDCDKRAKYFEQGKENALAIRMALLKMILIGYKLQI